MLNPIRDQAFVGLGADTGGAIDIYACRRAGLSDQRVHWLVDTGRWQSPLPRVFVTFSGPVPAITMQFAALRYAGADSTLSHYTAGALWQLVPASEAIHVTVPYSRDVDPQPNLVIHRSRTLSDSDVHPALTPRRTRIERTVVDLLATRRSADAALGLVASAIRGRHTDADRLRRLITELPKTRWRKLILEALPDISAGAHSPLELREARLRRRHGLPQGERQWRRLGNGAEYLDVFIREYGVHIELDGRLGHDAAREQWRDMRRDNRSEIARLRHLRYGWADIVDRPCEVAAQQAELLRQQGWPGHLKRCPACPSS
jgi:hypothetical protein